MALQNNKPNRKNLIFFGSLVAVTLVVIMVEWGAGNFSHRDSDSGGPSQCYFSDDDGATYFKGPVDQSVPFTKDGKVVNKAHVFKCSGKLVVGYLSRYSQAHIEAINHLADLQKQGKRPTLADQRMEVMGVAGTEVKPPGAKEWVNGADIAGSKIMAFKCPDSSEPGDEAYP